MQCRQIDSHDQHNTWLRAATTRNVYKMQMIRNARKSNQHRFLTGCRWKSLTHTRHRSKDKTLGCCRLTRATQLCQLKSRRQLQSCRNKLHNKSRTAMELRGFYSRPTCIELCASSNDASTITAVLHKLDRRRVLLSIPCTCRGEMFSESSVWNKISERTTIILEVPEFPYNTVQWKKARSCQLVSTELRVVKTQTRTDGDGIYCYRASIASRRAVTRVGTGMGVVSLASTPPGMPGTHPPNILVGGDVNGNIPANIITYFRI